MKRIKVSFEAGANRRSGDSRVLSRADIWRFARQSRARKRPKVDPRQIDLEEAIRAALE
jgi:hypothetical protein